MTPNSIFYCHTWELDAPSDGPLLLSDFYHRPNKPPPPPPFPITGPHGRLLKGNRHTIFYRYFRLKSPSPPLPASRLHGAPCAFILFGYFLICSPYFTLFSLHNILFKAPINAPVYSNLAF